MMNSDPRKMYAATAYAIIGMSIVKISASRSSLNDGDE